MYGLKDRDLKQIQKKHEVQRDYLDNNTFTTSTGQVKSLLDVSFSANHSKRYYSEIINKINTLNDIISTEEIQYQSIFITITLDGYFRDFLKGNFSRYNPLKHSKDIPNNERFGHLKNKIEKQEAFTIKDLYNVLNFQLQRFQHSSPYQKIKKNNHKAHYIRVCEPHKKDGVPHLHLMLYVPTQYLQTLKKAYSIYFPAPQNSKPLNTLIDDGQLKGFQWEIESAPAYILKYIFKSFLNVQNENELDYLQAWYIKHRILRVVTSHSIVPAWVYRKISVLDKDWHYLTDIKNNAVCEWSKEDDYILFEDEYKRTLEYNKGVYKLYYKDTILKEFGTRKEDTPVTITPTINLKYKKKIKEPKILIDGKTFILKDGKYEQLFIKRPIVYTSSFNLYKDFVSMENKDIDSFDLNHYALVKNELIKRNQISGEILPISDYKINFNYGF